MPTMKRHKTRYPGVWFIVGTGADGKTERIFYIGYRRNGKWIEEKAGRERKNDISAYGASLIRTARIEGKEPSNEERREAVVAARKAEAEKWTVNRLWEAYKESRLENKRSATDSSNFQNYLLSPFGDKEPAEILPLDVDRLRMSLTKKGKAAATVKNVLELLRRIVNFGVDRQLCPGLPFKIKMPKMNNLKTEDLTPEQLAQLLKVLRVGIVTNEKGEETILDPDAREEMLFALHTGMRRGEIFRLKWDDVDLRRGFLTIREPKGGVDQTIPLSEAANELLSKRSRREDSPFVFPGRGGRQRVDHSKQFRAIRKAAGLPEDFRPMHGIRHVFASTLASSGEVDLYTLQRLLTHKSPSMTMRYAHLRDETLKRAANVMGKIVEQTTADKDTKATHE